MVVLTLILSKCRCDNIGINLLLLSPLPAVQILGFEFPFLSGFPESKYIVKSLQTCFPCSALASKSPKPGGSIKM